MEENLIIEKVIAVYEGEFKPGKVTRRNIKRKSDGFIYYLSGSADYIFEAETISVSEGDLLYLPEGAIYNIKINETTSYICIDFSFTKKELSPSVIHNLRGIKGQFYKFFYNYVSNSPYRIPRAYEIINRIYCEILRTQSKEYSKSSELYFRATEIILQRYREQNFTVEYLASELGISTVHLRRIFSSFSEISPIKYINNIRFEQAKMLLLSSNLTVGEIAISVGFSDPFHFSKVFKASVGIAPSEYREIKGDGGINKYYIG